MASLSKSLILNLLTYSSTAEGERCLYISVNHVMTVTVKAGGETGSRTEDVVSVFGLCRAAERH